MAYSDEESNFSERKMLLLLIPAIIFFLWRWTPLPDYLNRLTYNPSKIEVEFIQDPVNGKMMEHFKKGYPDQFDNLVSNMNIAIQAGTKKDQLNRMQFEFMRDFVNQRQSLIRKAPYKELHALSTGQYELLSDFSEANTELCASYATSGIANEDILTIDQSTKLANLGILTLDAIKAGETSPVIRPTALPEALSTKLLSQIEEENLPATQNAIIINGPSANDNADDICKANLVLLKTINELPPLEHAHVKSVLLIDNQT